MRFPLSSHDFVYPLHLDTIYKRTVLAATIRKLTTKMRTFNKKHKFDTIVGTGLSGLLVLTPLALALRKHFLAIRREKEACHEYSHVGYASTRKYVIVDDLIASGNTIDRIITLAEKDNNKAKLVGIFLYSTGQTRTYKYRGTIPVFEINCKSAKLF